MILHIANITIGSQSGMGRIAMEWQKAFRSRGHQFMHISQQESGNALHPLLFGWKIRKHILKMECKPSLILAHEPLAGWLKFDGIPLVSFSHGVEERAWAVLQQHNKLRRRMRVSTRNDMSMRQWARRVNRKHLRNGG